MCMPMRIERYEQALNGGDRLAHGDLVAAAGANRSIRFGACASRTHTLQCIRVDQDRRRLQPHRIERQFYHKNSWSRLLYGGVARKAQFARHGVVFHLEDERWPVVDVQLAKNAE